MNTRNKGIVAAAAAGLRGQLRGKRAPIDTDVNLTGRRALVTGANSGLGKGIAIRLARQGATVVMAGRTLDESARKDVVRLSGNGDVHLERLDLASFSSVRDFIANAEYGLPFQIVVLNAAVIAPTPVRTDAGLDQMLQVNFLSNVLLVEELLKKDRIRPADDGVSPRIVVVSSEAHRWSDGFDPAQLDRPRSYTMKQVLGHYGDTKFLMAAYTAHLARRLRAQGSCIAVHALCPGAVNSNIARGAPRVMQPLLKVIFSLFFASPHKAAAPVFHLAASPALAGQSGLYYHQCAEKFFDERAADPAYGEAIAQRAMQICQAHS